MAVYHIAMFVLLLLGLVHYYDRVNTKWLSRRLVLKSDRNDHDTKLRGIVAYPIMLTAYGEGQILYHAIFINTPWDSITDC